jgi:hypothetical protein
VVEESASLGGWERNRDTARSNVPSNTFLGSVSRSRPFLLASLRTFFGVYLLVLEGVDTAVTIEELLDAENECQCESNRLRCVRRCARTECVHPAHRRARRTRSQQMDIGRTGRMDENA